MKKGIKHCICLLLIAVHITACRQPAGPADYLKAVEQDPALNKTVTIGPVTYTFSLVTPEAMALKSSLGPDGHVNGKAYAERLKAIKNILFVHIKHRLAESNSSILKYNLPNAAAYEQRVMYYEFYAREDIRLQCGSTELAPVEYQYENHMDISPFNTMVVTFPYCHNTPDWRIVFNDRAFGNLFIKVSFSQKDIQALPAPALN